MNQYISVGLSVAVAPAILLAYGIWTQSPDTITVSEWALFNFGIPIGGVLVAAGLLAMADKKVETFHHPLYPKAKKTLSRVAIECVLWAFCIAIAYEVITKTHKTTAYNRGDQPFLDAIIWLQALIGASVFRVFIALFKQERTGWRLLKIGVIIILSVVISGLTMCSTFVTERWGFG